MSNMKILLTFIILIGAFLVFFQNLISGEEGKPAGLVTYVEGTLKKKYLAAPEWTNAAKDTTVATGDKVRTVQDSRAEMELRDLDIIRLAPRTTIDIVELYKETKERKDQTKINVEEGDIWAMVGSVEAGASFDLSTPVAGAAITGTIFRVAVDKDSTTQLKVYKGEVKITNSPGNPSLQAQPLPYKERRQVSGPKQVPGPKEISFKEWMYVVKQMQTINIGKDGSLIASGDFSPQDADEQTDWVKWNQMRDKARLINR